MVILKILLVILLSSLSFGMFFVRYALRTGMRIPTNSELINSTKAYLKRPKRVSKEPVKAKNIRKLK